jgi:hypothetical protein
MTRTAHCSCGALRVEVAGEPDAVVACHCGQCQRRTGSVFGVGAFGDSGFPRPTRSVWEEAKHGWVAFAHDLSHLPQGRAA